MLNNDTRALSRAICAGCLSQDRKMSSIKALKTYASFCFLAFNEKDWVCWECKRMVVKLATFRRQVALAQSSLADLRNGRCCQIKSVSKLTSVTINEQPETGQLIVEMDSSFNQFIDDADKYKVEFLDDEATAYEDVEALEDIKTDEVECDEAEVVEDMIEEVLYEDEDNKEALIQLMYIEETEDGEAMLRGDNEVSNDGTLVKKATNGSSGAGNTAAVSSVNLNLDEEKRPKRKARKSKITKTASGSEATRTQDTLVEIENPFTIETMSQDEMFAWRKRKKDLKFYADCSPVSRCEECLEPFDSARMFTTHVKGHGKKFGDTPCDICQLNFQDEDELAEHTKRHYRLLTCKRCEFQWDSPNGMRAHCARAHGLPAAALLCDHCDKEYTTLRRLSCHRACHLAHSCPECGVALRGHVKKHMLRMHKELPLLRCPQCGLECKGNSGLRAHTKTCRSVADETFCAECGINFKSKYTYHAHFRKTMRHASEAQLRFQCSVCGKGFLDSATLLNHIDSVHEKKIKHKCEICGKGFFTLVSCRVHLRRAHGGRPVRKDHVCHYCGKTFQQARVLIHHVRTHTGERPHACPYCPTAYAQPYPLRRHLAARHPEAPKGLADI